jgi:hypothetical protein
MKQSIFGAITLLVLGSSAIAQTSPSTDAEPAATTTTTTNSVPATKTEQTSTTTATKHAAPAVVNKTTTIRDTKRPGLPRAGITVKSNTVNTPNSSSSSTSISH